VSYYRRRLPHWQPEGVALFITFRLHGSLPPGRYFPRGLTSGQAFVYIDRLLDKVEHGHAWLQRPDLAQLVVDAIRYVEEGLHLCLVHSFAVMPKSRTPSDDAPSSCPADPAMPERLHRAGGQQEAGARRRSVLAK